MYCLYSRSSTVLPGVQTVLFQLLAPFVVLVLLILIWVTKTMYVRGACRPKGCVFGTKVELAVVHMLAVVHVLAGLV